MQLKLKNPLAFFDLETTGINITHDRIVEISILKIHPNGREERRTDLVNPGIPIPIESSLIHGIYDKDVANAPHFKDIAKSLATYLTGCDLAGFNVLKFDVPVLVEEFLRADVNFDVSKRKMIDAQKIFHLMEKRNLSAAYKFYCNKTLENAHSAEADTQATYEILLRQIEMYEGQEVLDMSGNTLGVVVNDIEKMHNITWVKMVDLAGRMVFNDNGEEVFNFGKHKGKSVLEVLSIEPMYYDWIQKNDFALDTKRKLTEIKLRQFKR
jgi:DNA polymerase III subunit epsilon